jgi:hypothetical protein
VTLTLDQSTEGLVSFVSDLEFVNAVQWRR